MEKTKKKKRPLIGIMTGSFNSDYSRTLVKEFAKAFYKTDLDADLRLYSGMESTLFFGKYGCIDQGFDKHWLSVFEYSHFEDVDLLIVAYGNIVGSHHHIDASTFLPRLPQVPTIIVGSDSVMSDGCYIMIDNYLGMKQNVDHLIEEHGYKNIAFLSGPKGSPSAALRRKAYTDSLEEHGMEVREELIAYGDYTNNVDPVVEELFDRNVPIDAIVSCNDEMSNAVYRVVKSRGYRIGVDMAVVGFDDEKYAEEMVPPLSTVRQDYRLLAEGLVCMVADFMAGKEISSMRIPARCIRRRSCGCKYESPRSKLADNGMDPTNRYYVHNGMFRMLELNMISALVLRNLLTNFTDRRGFFNNLALQMQDIGARSAYALLLEQPVCIEHAKEFVLPDTLRLYMRLDGEEYEGYDEKDAPVVSRRGMDAFFDREKGVCMAVFILFYDAYQYGILAAEIDPEDALYFYFMSFQVGSALRYLEYAEQQERANNLLEQQNKMLDYAAYHDGLTELYNRLGVMDQIPKFMAEHEKEKYFVCMMADLDHLKQINDTFGHPAGDQAIWRVSRVLTECLPEGSPIGRNGGDEFMAAFIGDEKVLNEVCRKIKKACDDYNETAGKPYYVGISVGAVPIVYTGSLDMDVAFKKADEKLYIAKKSRRTNVVKEWAR